MLRLIITAALLSVSAVSAHAKMSLEESIQFAYERNPELQAQAYALKAAESRKFKSYAGFLPKISLDINNGEQNTKISEGNKIEGSVNKKSLNFSQEIFNGGASIFEVKKSNSAIGREIALKDAKEQEVMFEVIKAYLDVVRYRQLLKMDEENIESQEKILKHIKIKLKVRDATMSELAKANADYASAISSKSATTNNLVAAKSRLAKVTGVSIAEIGSLAKLNYKAFDAEIRNYDSDDLSSKAISMNPEVRAARHGLAIAKYDSFIAKSSLSPSLNLTAGTSEEKNPLYYNNQTYRNNSVYLNLHIPIFDSGVKYANIGEYKNLLRQEKSNLEAAQNRVRSDVFDYISQARNYYSQYNSYQEQEHANATYVKALQKEVRLGTKSVIELLRAKKDLHDSKVNKTNIYYDKMMAVFNLKKLVGDLTYVKMRDAYYFDKKK